MSETSDINATRIALVGALGTILTVAVTLVAVVAYFAVAQRVDRSRSDEAAERIHRQAADIAAGNPVAQPWLNADLQRATQETQLTQYRRRTIAEETGTERTVYSIPIDQAMESILKQAVGSSTVQPKNEGATQ